PRPRRRLRRRLAPHPGRPLRVPFGQGTGLGPPPSRPDRSLPVIAGLDPGLDPAIPFLVMPALEPRLSGSDGTPSLSSSPRHARPWAWHPRVSQPPRRCVAGKEAETDDSE